MTAITTEALITGANVRVKRTRHGFVLYNQHDAYIGRSIELYGEFSEEETKLFARIVKPGMTVVDIGANIGAHTLFFAAAVGPSGAVIAFEPQRVLYQMLCANLALNEITNVRPLQMGAGRESGQAFIPGIDYAKPGNFGGIALGRQGIGEEVMVAPIDQIGLEQCHFMKIDVEGMEEEAILGAKETIARHRPILYVENDRREKSPSLIRRLLEMNYLLRWHLPPLFSAENAYRNAQNVFPDIVSVNMLCVPREADPNVADSAEIVDPDAWPLGPAPSPPPGGPARVDAPSEPARPITPRPLGRQPGPLPGKKPAGKTFAPTPDVVRALTLEQAGRLDEAAQL
jgi:FkbM family methyltransferase